jgi:hypothetical protein
MDKVQLLALLPEANRGEVGIFLDSLNPLKGVDTKDQALVFIEKSDLFMSAFDSKVTSSVETFKVNNQIKVDKQIEDAKLEATRIAEEKINPALTDDQKLIKTMQADLKLQESKMTSMKTESTRDKQLLIAQEHIKGKMYDGVDIESFLGKTSEETILNLDSKLIKPYADFRAGEEARLAEVVKGLVSDTLNGGKPPKSNNGKSVIPERFGKTALDTLNIATESAKLKSN